MSLETSNVPVVILCGGSGIFIDASGRRVLKSLVKISGNPIFFRILESYARFDFRRFILATGYQHDQVLGELEDLKGVLSDLQCSVQVVFTGEDTPTAERLEKLRPVLGKEPHFGLCYSDILTDVDLGKLFSFHLKNNVTASILAAQIPSRFRVLGLLYGQDHVQGFTKHSVIQSDWVSGGYYFFNRGIWDASLSGFIDFDVFNQLSRKKQLVCFRHKGAWRFLDSERDIPLLEGVALEMRGKH